MPEPGASALGFEVPSGGPGGRVSPDRASPREARGNAEASDVRRRAPAQTTEGRCVAWPWGGPKAAAAAAPAAAGAREGPLGRLSRDRGEEGGRPPSLPSARPVMILPQVHLRKPCYDFYFL